MRAGRTFAVMVACLMGTLAARAQTAASPSGTMPSATMPTPKGTPLDRVVAIVNGDLILDSDVDEEMRFDDLTSLRAMEKMTREAVIERLINRDLILQQAAIQPGDAISDDEVTKEIGELRKTIPACKKADCQSDAGWAAVLKPYGLTPAEVQARWKTRMQVLAFIELRFRTGARITDEQVKEYYEQKMLPVYAKQGVTAPKLETIEDRIRELLIQEQVTNLLSDWLKSLRAQGSVVVLHPGEAVP